MALGYCQTVVQSLKNTSGNLNTWNFFKNIVSYGIFRDSFSMSVLLIFDILLKIHRNTVGLAVHRQPLRIDYVYTGKTWDTIFLSFYRRHLKKSNSSICYLICSLIVKTTYKLILANKFSEFYRIQFCSYWPHKFYNFQDI